MVTTVDPEPCRRLRVRATTAFLASVADFVDTVARDAGMPSWRGSALRLAVEELLMNVIIHGYGPAAPHAEALIEADLTEDSLRIRISDTAPFFDPVTAALPAVPTGCSPGGVGLRLAREAADDMFHGYVRGGNQTTIVMYLGEGNALRGLADVGT